MLRKAIAHIQQCHLSSCVLCSAAKRYHERQLALNKSRRHLTPSYFELMSPDEVSSISDDHKDESTRSVDSRGSIALVELGNATRDSNAFLGIAESRVDEFWVWVRGSVSHLFEQPVDVSRPGCDDYYQVIEHPMCMKTIEYRVKRKFYHSLAAFKEDVMLMFQNCLAFNKVTGMVVWLNYRTPRFGSMR